MPADIESPQKRRLLRLTAGSVLAAAVTRALGETPAAGTLSLADLPIGHTRTLKLDRYRILLLRRDREMIRHLVKQTADLADPDSTASQQPVYATNAWRSRDPAYLVLINHCTFDGCPTAFGACPTNCGFSCPCCGSRFDAAGRVLKFQPAPRNLAIPHYHLDRRRKLVVIDRVEDVRVG